MKKTLTTLLTAGLVLSSANNCREKTPARNPETQQVISKSDERFVTTTRAIPNGTIPYYHHSEERRGQKIINIFNGLPVLMVWDYEKGVDVLAGYIEGEYKGSFSEIGTPVTLIEPIEQEDRERAYNFFKRPKNKLRVWQSSEK